jgi:Mrp family chromosome partitioning ATPase
LLDGNPDTLLFGDDSLQRWLISGHGRIQRPMNDTTDAAALFAPLWRRKWLILIIGVLVALASYVYYKGQPSVYAASTQLNLASGNEEQGVLGNQGKIGVAKAALSNAATIITSGMVAEEAHRILRAEHAKGGKGKVRAKISASGSDIVTITAEVHGAKAAARLANAYARAYIRRERVAYVRAVKKAMRNTHQQLRRIELAAAGPHTGKGSKTPSSLSGTALTQAASLATKLNQLESDLLVQSIQQISPARAKTAELVEPMPKKNAIFGFAIGVVLAALIAFIAERFDRSLRGLSDIEAVLRAPILTALPTVTAPVTHVDGRPAPAGPLIEPVRRLNTTLRLRGAPTHEGAPPRVILCTSAQDGDGKSTVVANLAIVRRDAGDKVAVIEADFRRPVLAKLLDVSGELGLADVLAGTRAVWDVLQTVPSMATAGADARQGAGNGATIVQTRTTGSLSVLLGGGSTGASPLLGDHAFTELVSSMSEEFDCVLIDAPSPLEVSDAIPLFSAVEGILVVARVRRTRDVSAERLTELLALPSSAPVLGVVANDVSNRELTRSGFATGRSRSRWSRSPIRR